MNTFDTWHLYKNHCAFMSITNFHALNLKELIDNLSKFLLQVTKNNRKLYPPTRLYDLCFFFWILFCHNYFCLNGFFLFVLWNEFFVVFLFCCCVVLQCYFMLSIESSSLKRLHEQLRLMCLN